VQTAPTFTIGGSTYNDVGSAITALASASGGGSGVVKYSNPATPTTPNSGTATNSATLVGAAAASPVNLANVAAGTVTATSTDAVNGSQLFAVKSAADGALQRSGGTMTGGINMGGNVISNLAGPVVATDAANKAYVDGKFANNDQLGASTASVLGAGSTYDPATGKISAPNYSVGGKSYANVGTALAATNALAVQYVADANGAPTNTVKLTGNGNGQAVAVTNVAAGKVAAGSTDAVNGGQLYTVQVLASNSLQYDRNTDGSSNYGSASLGGGSAGNNTVLHNVATGVAANDAVNVIQLAAAQQSTLGLAKDYTDKAFGQLAFDLKEVSKKAYAGTAAAIALQAPGLFEPGTLAMRGGMGYYRGEFALGLSVRATADNGRWSLSGGVAGGKNGGVAASAGIDFVLGR
jgi:trimeric autotransporter adhesin